MLAETARAMARYNRWMNHKLYAVAGALSAEERTRDRGAFFGSIHGTLNHLLLADRVWMSRFCDNPELASGIAALDQELFAEFEPLRAAREAMDETISAWATALSDADLGGTLRYRRRDQTIAHPLWWAATHMFNHQTHHRGQITTLLSQAGRDPGVTDLIAMLRDETPGA